jgi:hypothetical protein
MTKLNYYTTHHDEALTIATNICQTRREKAGIPGLCDADVEMEYSLILEEWWYDYRNEHV